MLEAATKLGHPRLHHLQRGWYFCIELNTVVCGSKVEVASDFGHSSASMAAAEGMQRAAEMVRLRNG